MSRDAQGRLARGPKPCGVKASSAEVEDHVHECGGPHEAGYHKCKDPKCDRWFWTNNPIPSKPKVKRVRPRRV